MRTWLAIVVVAAQIALLAFMAGQREWVMRTGRILYLRTAPIDPNDPMRGDYLRLNYDISQVPQRLCRDGVVKWFDEKPGEVYRQLLDRRVYAQVQPNAEGVAELVALSDRPPANGTYLRGRVESLNAGLLRVRYGIEAFFLPQAKAAALDRARSGDYAGVPLNIEVAVSLGGLAVAKSYRWEPLGLTLRLDRPPRSAAPIPAERRSGLTGATVVLQNHSDHPVAIVVRPRGQSFRLIRNEAWAAIAVQTSGYEWIGEKNSLPPPRAEDVRILAPGQSYEEHLDFTQPAWFVLNHDEKAKTAGPVSLQTLRDAWGTSFRIEYAPPTADECAGLPQAELIRHSRLLSRAFSPAAGAD